ncbi:ParB N-terminal domain-containing protein [Agrobacterium sp. CR_3]|uniref:ParB N-terminal domain-containing protein n=1 Tax=unclassified Agrobacterium TaxID=2632611 RepID=UPI0035C0587B
MQIIKVDARAQGKSRPDASVESLLQADALMLATIKAVGIVQPPVVAPEKDGGNGYVIDAGHRRVRLAIAASLEEVEILVVDAAHDNGAMRSLVENSVREASSHVRRGNVATSHKWQDWQRLGALARTLVACRAFTSFQVQDRDSLCRSDGR